MPFVFIRVISGSESDMKQANITSQVNGVSQSFTIPEAIQANSLRVYWNGLKQTQTTTYSETGTTTFSTNFTPLNGDVLTIEYIPS
tara:strand:+ start:295 stop:552 length:258 start_codon:yes stop_codon:yes gene_type:complete